MVNETDFKPRDFVFTGLRLDTKNNLYASLVVLNEDDTVDRPWSFDVSTDKQWRKRIVGGVYRGALFNETKARGLSLSVWTKQWPDTSQRIDWQARHDETLEIERSLKLEKDAGRVSDIETQMLALRKLYAGYVKRYDTTGMRCLERAVIAALHSPPRKSELED